MPPPLPPENTPPDRSWTKIVLVVATGLFSLGLTFYQCYNLTALLWHARYAEGVILHPESHPTIRFTDAAGEVIDFVQNGFISRPLGAAVPVLYEPADPRGTAQAATFWTTWGTALWMLPAGLGFTLFGLLEARAKWRRPKPAP